jgi:hypothetical protein
MHDNAGYGDNSSGMSLRVVLAFAGESRAPADCPWRESGIHLLATRKFFIFPIPDASVNSSLLHIFTHTQSQSVFPLSSSI